MSALRVVEILRRMEQGRTRPFLVRAEDDALYVAKGRETTQRGLVAEWLCAHLGRALDLPIPPFTLLEVPAELVAALGAEGGALGASTAFGSRLESGVQDFAIAQLRNVDVALRRRLLAFDWWVENADRTLSELGGNPNLLWRAAGDALLVIDHNLAFDREFDESTFFATHVFHGDASALFEDWINWTDAANRLRAALPSFDEALASMPEQWNWLDPEATLPVGIDWTARRARLDERINIRRGRTQ
ncbi:hypothetical protein B2A_15680 [mine drainage metagenome]|uniref:HipA-like kinase domain-containing protein n=1 Tax=mine drainage metagenome TaxID=410659 RepID=T0ZBI8_9ZZZZ